MASLLGSHEILEAKKSVKYETHRRCEKTGLLITLFTTAWIRVVLYNFYHLGG